MWVSGLSWLYPYLGIKAALDSSGNFSFCWEGGVGVGVGIEIDPLASPDPSGTKAAAEVGLDVAGVGVSGKLERILGSGPYPGETSAEFKGLCLHRVPSSGQGRLGRKSQHR